MIFRNDIQGLRAIAVLLVFIFHLSAGFLPGGFIGVDMFFVISGFLVSNIVYNKINTGKFSLVGFYESRLKRIVPAYFFLLLVVGIVASFLFVSTDLPTFQKSLFWTIIFNSNNHFAGLDNYFGASSEENPLLHTWTLAIEMQFYFLLPLILLCIRNKKLLITLLSTLILCFLLYSTHGILNDSQGVMYFSLPSRMPEFLIGVIAAIIKIEDKTFIKRNTNILSIIGIIMILISAIFFNKNTLFPGALSLLPCLGTLALLLSKDSRLNNILSLKPVVFIGEISYSIYLWHWPIMAFFRYYNNRYNFTPYEVIAVIFLTIALSLTSYYFIEKPFRKSQKILFYIPFTILSMGLAAVLIFSPKINNKIFGGDIQMMSPWFGVESHGTAFKKVQIFGDTTQTVPHILLIGDSHALCMKKYVDVIGKRNGISFRAISNNTYPLIPGMTNEQIPDKKHLNEYNKLIQYTENEIKKSKLIILQFAGTGEKWIKPLKKMLISLKPNQKILVIQDFPILDKNPVRINRSIYRNKQIKQNYTLIKSNIHPEILKLIASFNNSQYLKLDDSSVFANAPFYRDTLMYYDKGHLNIYGAKVYAINTESKFLEAISWGTN